MDGRKAITSYARTFVGSHYLWGSGGACPGVLNGARYRPGSVPWNEASLHLSNLSLCAAKCDVAGHYVCAGCYQKAGGQTVSTTDVALTTTLTNYLAKYGSAQLAEWDARTIRLTPRRVAGAGVPSSGKIAFGENCTTIRHFDCISFINFVLSDCTKIPDPKFGWSNDIKGWATGKWATDVSLTEPAVAGDILIRYSEDEDGRHYHHIAFLDDNNFVVQAEMASTGVHADERYSANAWQLRRRLDPQFIRPDLSTFA